jgi:putative sugar O-methyltransferase
MLRTAKALVHQSAAAFGYRIERVTAPPNHISNRLRRLWSNDDPTVRVVKDHLEQSHMPDDLPSLGDRWGAYAARLRARISAAATPEDLVYLGQSSQAGVETHQTIWHLPRYCRSFDLQLLADLPSDLYDAFASFRSPRLSRPDCTVEYNGRSLDFVSLCAARTILTILSWLPPSDRPRTVLDIGGGTGKYALSWLRNSAHRPDLVAILDIPETLVYSETVLRNELGDGAVQYLSTPTTIPNRSGIVLCPIGNARALAGLSFDLVTNTGSMQEMPDAWIDWYMDFLDRQPCRHFFSDNYFTNALVDMAEGHNSWSPRPSARWQMIRSKLQLGERNTAYLLFARDRPPGAKPSPDGIKGAEAWLVLLDEVRLDQSERNLRRALAFSQSELPFIPKESWQIAKTLAELTGSVGDKDAFLSLNKMRKGGTEAVFA